MAANPKETTAIIRENAADHALRPLFMRFEWTRCSKSKSKPGSLTQTLVAFPGPFFSQHPVTDNRILTCYCDLMIYDENVK